MFDYYPDRSSPILVNFGLCGVTAAALLPDELYTHRTWEKCLPTNQTWGKKLCCEAQWAVGIGHGLVGQSELEVASLGKAVWWDCVLQAC